MSIDYDLEKTAIILIGYQNDYFSSDGLLQGALEDVEGRVKMLAHTQTLLEGLKPTPALIISTPIVFTSDYRELREPTGILEVIKDVGAFREGEKGSETIPELRQYGERILEVPGKRGPCVGRGRSASCRCACGGHGRSGSGSYVV